MKSRVFHRSSFGQVALLCALFTPLFFHSCGLYEEGEVASSEGTGSVVFSVKWVPDTADLQAMEERAVHPLAEEDICDVYGINQVKVEVFRADESTTGVSATKDCSAHAATLSGVPANADLYVEITTIPEGYEGRSEPFTLVPGGTEDLGTIPVTLAPIPPPWHSPTIINADSGEVTDLQIAMDGSGNAIVIWSQNNTQLFAKRYTPEDGWGTATLLDNSGDVGQPQIAMNSSGNAIAVWTQGVVEFENWDGNFAITFPRVYVNEYTPLGGWNTSALLDSSSMDPQIAMANSGAAFAVWQWIGGCITIPCVTTPGVYGDHFTPADGWGEATLLSGYVPAYSPRIALDGSDNAIAVWSDRGSTYPPYLYSVNASRYTLSDGWGTTTVLDSGLAVNCDIAMDINGNAIAVWKKGEVDIYGNLFTTLDGWSSATLLDGLSGDVGFPIISMDGSGTAIVVWKQLSGGYYNLNAKRYTPTGGWGSTTLLELNNGDTDSPDIAMDGSGNAIAVWKQEDATYNSIYANEYTVSSVFGGATLIENETGNGNLPRIAMDGSGTAIAVWAIDGIIYANHYY